MSEIERIIEVAKKEVGYLEKKSNKDLDDKKANVGKGNYTKYARDLDNISGFYNGKKNGYAWCDVFVDWCFVQAFGVTRAKELLCQPNNSLGAGVPYSAKYYKSKNQFYSSKPKVGDQIFLNKNNHTGLVYKVDSKYVYTIEGNLNNGVNKKTYSLNSSSISGYGRPNYYLKEEVITPENKNDIIDVEYQSYDNISKKWWDIIKNYNNNNSNGYAGYLGHDLGGLRARLSNGGTITIQSHIKGGEWLSPIDKWDDTSNGYSGVKGKPIDKIMIKSDKGTVHYRVHIKNGSWLPWVTGFNKDDSKNGYAGITRKTIDGIQIYID